METELKMLVAEADVLALQHHPLLKKYAAVDSHREQLADTYFDTPELHLRQAGAGLRVRQIGDRCVQTMKAGGSVRGGLHRRNEWESPVTQALPDIGALRTMLKRHGKWGMLLSTPWIEDRLEPVFSIKTTRTVWTLRLPQGDEVEGALDEGLLTCGEVSVPIHEFELELKSGTSASLFAFALELQGDIAFRIAETSKAERGYALLAPRPWAAVKAAPLALQKKMSLEKAFKKITLNCLTQILDNEAGVVQFNDSEALHQMRVGVRRLRAALALFRKEVDLPDELKQELDWLGEVLGPARDWSVLASTTMERMAAVAPTDIALQELSEVLQNRARTTQGEAAAAVMSARFTRFVLLLTAWIERRAWRDGASPGQRRRLHSKLQGFTRNSMVRSHLRLIKRGAELRAATQRGRHRVRIAVKQARYAADFFQSLMPPNRLHRYVEGLASLQDALGWLNDAANADRMLQELAGDDDRLAASIAFVRGYLLSKIEVDSNAMESVWKSLDWKRRKFNPAAP